MKLGSSLLKLFILLFFFKPCLAFAQSKSVSQKTDYSKSNPLKYRRVSLNGLNPEIFLQTVADSTKYNFNSIEVQMVGGNLAQIKNVVLKDKQYNLIKTAHDGGLEVYLWVHEFEDLPEEWFNTDPKNLYNAGNDKGNKFIRSDNKELWAWLENKYENIVKSIPEADGYILTLAESQYWATGDEEVAFKTVQTIYNVLKKYRKKLVYRTFCYTPQQMELLSKVAQRLPRNIILEAKEVPQDWHFYLPHAQDIGLFPEHEQIIELDVAGEYWGRSMLLNAFPRYILERLSYCVHSKNAKGIVVRINRANDEVKNTFNDINLYAAAAFMNNPSVKLNDVWKQWAEKKFGNKAANIAIRCLKPTWEATKQTIYTKGYIIADRKPAPSLIAGFVPRAFNPHNWDKSYEPVWEKIQHPTEDFISETIKEKKSAANVLEKSFLLFQDKKQLFTDSIYQELNFQLQRSKISLDVYSLISEAMLRYELFKQSIDNKVKQKQLERLFKIAEELRLLRTKLVEDHVVNGKMKELQFYLTNIKPSVFEEFESALTNKKL